MALLVTDGLPGRLIVTSGFGPTPSSPVALLVTDGLGGSLLVTGGLGAQPQAVGFLVTEGLLGRFLVTKGLGTGLAAAVVINSIYAVDARTVDIVFNQRVVEVDAETLAKYSISPALAVVAIKKVTDRAYRLTTSRQLQGVLYTTTLNSIGAL